MKLLQHAVAGSLESGDIQVMIEPSDKITVELESDVYKQFGEEILDVINRVIKEFELEGIKLKAVDKGALNFVIESRVKTAITRACDTQYKRWDTL
jgi:citrate lyase subunit gamma (acyl carrier protein)